MGETTTVPLPCPICGTDLRLSVTTNKNGKHAIGVHCPEDGRHFRGFINHRPFVEGALDRLLAAQAEQNALPDGATAPTAADQALQNDNGGRAPAPVAKKRRRAG
jgi:hypothetical protein